MDGADMFHCALTEVAITSVNPLFHPAVLLGAEALGFTCSSILRLPEQTIRFVGLRGLGRTLKSPILLSPTHAATPNTAVRFLTNHQARAISITTHRGAWSRSSLPLVDSSFCGQHACRAQACPLSRPFTSFEAPPCPRRASPPSHHQVYLRQSPI